MRFGHLLAAAVIQLVVFLVPLAAGIMGWVSGGLAGLTAVVSWFAIGIPLSFGVVDALDQRQRRALERSPVAPVRTSAPLARHVDLH